MMLVRIKTYPALLWALSLLFSVESMHVTVPEVNSTAHLINTTETASQTSLHHEADHQPSPVPSEPTVIPIHEAAVTQIPISSTQSHSRDSRGSATGVAINNTSVGTITSSGARLDHISSVPSTAAPVPGATQPSYNVSVSETEHPTEHPSTQQSVMTLTNLPATASAGGLGSSSQSTTKPDIISSVTLHSTLAPSVNQKDNTTVSITTSGSSTIITSNSGRVDATSQPSSVTKAPTTNTELLTTSQATSTTRAPVSSSKVPNTTGPTSTSDSPPTSEAITNTSGISTTAISTTAISTTPVGVLIPRVPKTFLTTKSPSATTTVTHPENQSEAGVQPCLTPHRGGVVHQCLIAIASLAGVATIFMVSTIILCAKLSTKRKYRIRESQQGTEMVCISSLLPERSHVYGRHYNPKSNGALLHFSDSDEDGGDNLTLSSFLPDNDRVV